MSERATRDGKSRRAAGHGDVTPRTAAEWLITRRLCTQPATCESAATAAATLLALARLGDQDGPSHNDVAAARCTARYPSGSRCIRKAGPGGVCPKCLRRRVAGLSGSGERS
jgi:hypothetical protein